MAKYQGTLNRVRKPLLSLSLDTLFFVKEMMKRRVNVNANEFCKTADPIENNQDCSREYLF